MKCDIVKLDDTKPSIYGHSVEVMGALLIISTPART